MKRKMTNENGDPQVDTSYTGVIAQLRRDLAVALDSRYEASRMYGSLKADHDDLVVKLAEHRRLLAYVVTHSNARSLLSDGFLMDALALFKNWDGKAALDARASISDLAKRAATRKPK